MDSRRDDGRADLTAATDEIYRERFSQAASEAKEQVWRPLGRFLQRWIPSDSAVLDIASDRGHFINNIRAKERWASDLRDTSSAFGDDVRFVRSDGRLLAAVVPHSYFDRIFMSNYLEHLPSAEAVIQQFSVVRQLLKPGGRVIVLQPNIRLTGGRYWDFIDHKVALTERSLAEAAKAAGLVPRECIVRFLPYTTKSHLPQPEWIVGLYLALRPVWWVFGKQTLFFAERPDTDGP